MPFFRRFAFTAACLILPMLLFTGMSPKAPEEAPRKQLAADVPVKKLASPLSPAEPTEADIPALKARAAKGDPAAQAAYGWWLVQRNEQESEVQEGTALMRKSAEAGNAEAQFRYALFLLSGWDRDPEQAVPWLEKAAAQKYPWAFMALAEIVAARQQNDEESGEKFQQQRAAYLRGAASQGLAEAAWKLGTLYFEGRELPHDGVAAYTWLYLARHGFERPVDPNAMKNSGRFYDEDSYDNPLKFLPWTLTQEEMRRTEAALAAWPALPPEPAAPLTAGKNAYSGRGLRIPPPLVLPAEIADLQRKAEGGDAAAADALGRLYVEGRGVPRDPAKAIALFTQAAEGGNVDGALDLAQGREGQDVVKNREKAQAALTKAAENGDARAQAGLARLLLNPPYDDPRSDEAKAADATAGLTWLEKAVARNNQQAMGDLAARAKQAGDLTRAAELYERAAAMGGEWALMGRLDVAESQRDAKDMYAWISIFMSCQAPEQRLSLRAGMLTFAGGLTDTQVLEQKTAADAWLQQHPQVCSGMQGQAAAQADFAKGKDESGYTPLHLAALKNDLPEVKRLLEEKADPNSQDYNGRTPLHLAAASPGGLETVRLLIAAGAYVNAQAEFGETPLSEAVERDNTEVVTLLLQGGANPNLGGGGPGNPLMAAISLGSTEMVRLLLASGANVNAPGWGGNALELSLQRPSGKEIFPLLLAAGADVNAVSLNGGSALHEAVKAKNTEAVKALLAAKANPNIRSAWGETPLYRAVAGGETAIVSALLAGGADANARQEKGAGETPLYLAVKEKRADVIKVLLAGGADPNLAAGERDFTPLHVAADLDDAEPLRLLLAGGAKVDAVDDIGRTPLHLAADRARAEQVALLLAAKANPSSMDKNGYTPLLEVVISHPEATGIVKALLAAGADTKPTESYEGKTALHMAAREGRLDLVKLLLAAKADPNAPEKSGRGALDLATDQKVIDALKKAGAKNLKADSGVARYDELGRPMNKAAEDAQAKGSSGGAAPKKSVYLSFFSDEEANAFEKTVEEERAGVKSPYLTRAVLMDFSLEALGERIKAGADVNGEDPVFGTPLSQAIEQHRGIEMVRFLLEKGADPNKGKPLLESISRSNLEVFLALLGAGADPNTQDDEGTPVLCPVAKSGPVEAVRALLEAGAKVDAKDADGVSAISYALKRDDGYPIISLLLEKGAVVKDTPALLALDWDEESVNTAILLLKHGASTKVIRDNGDRDSLAHWAVHENSLPLLEAAAAAGASVTLRDRDGDTALYLAVRRGQADMARALIKAGAPVNGSAIVPGEKFSSSQGIYDGEDDLLAQALDEDEEAKSLEVVKVLLENGVNLNARANHYERRTALHKAIDEGMPEAALLILKAGADPNIGDRDQDRPLHTAVEKGDMPLVTALLAAKADPNAQNKDGETPLFLAADKGRADMLEALLAAGGKVDITAREWRVTPLHMAAAAGSPACVELLLKAGADANARRGVENQTPLHYAVRTDVTEKPDPCPPMITLLLAAGADVNAAMRNGDTPLLLAMWGGSEATARLLIEKGAKINAKGGYGGETPLYRAAEEGRADLVRVLLEAGADPNLGTDKGITPLDAAMTAEVTAKVPGVKALAREAIKLLEAAGAKKGK